MQRTCANAWCRQVFEITDDDLRFYQKVSPVFGGKKELIPPPTRCPECRQQRRLAHANRYHLYRRKCDASGKEIISIYSPEKTLTVYEEPVWWRDTWDPLRYGREVSFSIPVFQQMNALCRQVPWMALFNADNQNCPYVNWTGWAKNCHLCYGADHSEDCLYAEATYHSRNSLECTYGHRLERCYECLDCKDCYGLFFSQNCMSCNDAAFLYGCTSCRECFGCVNLHQQQYRFFNKQLSKEEYLHCVRGYFPLTPSSITELQRQLTSLRLEHPHRFMTGAHNERATGDYLFDSKNAMDCFDCLEVEDCVRVTNTRGAKDCHDMNFWGHPGELCYECMAAGEGVMRALFCNAVWSSEDMLYCASCIACRDCFACAGLHRKQYCILNKQYSKEEYEERVPKVIAHMRSTGEWGEFFPVSFSLFAYDETLAQEFFPLTREEVEGRGWKWREEKDEIPHVERIIPAERLPERISDIPDDIINWAIQCEETHRPYLVTRQELRFYRGMQLPVPRLHPDVRRRLRMARHNPRKLWKRNCMKCEKEIETTYAPDRPEKVYCEQCYLQTVY